MRIDIATGLAERSAAAAHSVSKRRLGAQGRRAA